MICAICAAFTVSRPARGAWVEMIITQLVQTLIDSRAPQGARGLKSEWYSPETRWQRSRPARGAWVEIKRRRKRTSILGVAPRKGRVG